jgi:hypothetical protein
VKGIVAAWKKEMSESKFAAVFIASFVVLIVVLHFFTRFLGWVEAREGVTLNDAILGMIEPRDFTWLTFGVIYVAVILAIVHLVSHPRRLLVAMQAYTLMVVVRMFMMWLVPLDPPAGMILLRDPVVQLVGNGDSPTRDLFFSGHTATLFLLFLTASNRIMKTVFLISTLLVAILVLWQHVHYTIDVLVAPFVAWGCFRLAERQGPLAESD